MLRSKKDRQTQLADDIEPFFRWYEKAGILVIFGRMGTMAYI
jgi:hypothetical protein